MDLLICLKLSEAKVSTYSRFFEDGTRLWMVLFYEKEMPYNILWQYQSRSWAKEEGDANHSAMT